MDSSNFVEIVKSKTRFEFAWTIKNFEESFEVNDWRLESPVGCGIGHLICGNGSTSSLYITLHLQRNSSYSTRQNNPNYLVISVNNLSDYLAYCTENDTKVTVTIKIVNAGHILMTHIMSEEVLYIKENEILQKIREGCDTSLTLLCQIAENIDENVDPDTVITRRLNEFDDFGQLLHDEEHSDVTLVVGNEKLQAHKCILSKKSPVFAAMFRHKMLESENSLVNIEDFKVDVLKELLTFVYTGKIGDIAYLDRELYQAADKYQIQGLKIICEDVMCQKLTTANVYDYLDFARHYKINKLKNASVKFIASHESALILTQLT